MIWDLRRELRRQLEEIGFVERARRWPAPRQRQGFGGASAATAREAAEAENGDDDDDDDELETQELADPNLLKTVLASALYPQVRITPPRS